MTERTPAHRLDAQGIATNAAVHWNLTTAPLVEKAVERGEGKLTKHGALLVDTGKFTGRSVKDKYIVRDSATEETINWGAINQPMAPENWANLKADFMAALAAQEELYVADLFGGSQAEYRVNVRVINQMAWHNLFIRTLLVRPSTDELPGFVPEYTIVNLPSFKADPARHGCRSDTIIAVNFTEKLILIGSTEYSGEMKKGVFGLLNYLLPAQGVMPMHCSANIGADGKSAIFFGLSGTGKTTLSADASRTLIGDDEHGWSDQAVFNFEGGCYAKMINLSAEGEPEIYATTQMFGTILENVAMDEVTRNWTSPTPARLRILAVPIRLNSFQTCRKGTSALRRRTSSCSLPMRSGCCPRSRVSPPIRLCTISCRATPPKSPAQRSESPSRKRPSQPASAPPSCRAIRRSTATC